MKIIRYYLQEFARLESTAGILLCCFALLGLMLAQIPAAFSVYETVLYKPLTVSFLSFSLTTSFSVIINDGFMSLFFLVIGLEIKREMLTGELYPVHKALLPLIAAIAGMVFPALIYVLCNLKHPELWRGFAIPTATDIAFALGILSLLGRRIPHSVKVFLTALAIFDDLGAILIIALFYTAHIRLDFLIFSGISFFVLCLLNQCKIKLSVLYWLSGFTLWYCLAKSGIHATIAGFLLALTLPLDKDKPKQQSLLYQTEERLHPWVAYLILPLFAFANSGVSFASLSLHTMTLTLPLGIGLGLFIGKQMGILLALWVSTAFRLAPLPHGSRLSMLYGVALLCGIGFTVSLFIANLAFAHEAAITYARLGILAGSLLSGIAGYLVLRASVRDS